MPIGKASASMPAIYVRFGPESEAGLDSDSLAATIEAQTGGDIRAPLQRVVAGTEHLPAGSSREQFAGTR